MDRDGQLPNETDVVIIGGGIMGTSTAFFLSTETDRDVVLVEKASIAAGSTSDSSAVLRHHYGPQEQYTRMARWSHEFYRAFEEKTGFRIAREENPLVRVAEEGTVAGEYAEDGYEMLRALDLPTTRYSRDEFEDAYPMLDYESYDFAISDDSAGYSDGYDAASGFAGAARENGATIVTDTEVVDIRARDGSIVGVDTDAGSVDCEGVVLAAGAWTPRLAAKIDVDVPVTPEREQVLILDPPAEYDEKYEKLPPTTALPGGQLYLRPDFGDGILVATHHSGDDADPDDYDNSPDEEVLLDLTRQLDEIVPGLTDAGIRGQYCGIYSNTPDHDFIIDQVGPSGCFVACGFSGHGFKHGPAVGKILTDLLVEGETDLVDVEFFSIARFEDDPTGHGLPDDLA